MTPEARIKAKVKKKLTALGCYWIMPMGTGYGNSGVPDFVVCYRGLFKSIECKAEGNTPTALQLKHAADIEKSGGHWLVVDEHNVDNFIL